MYQNNNSKPYGGLGRYFGASQNNKEVEKVAVNPEAYIPKAKKRLGPYDAMRLAQRWNKFTPQPKLEDPIYWKSKNGEPQPVVSTTGKVGLNYLGPMTEGRRKVKITPPPIKHKKITKVVKDLPVVESLAPASGSGLGMFYKEGKPKLVCVLGLILLGLYLYNKKQSG